MIKDAQDFIQQANNAKKIVIGSPKAPKLPTKEEVELFRKCENNPNKLLALIKDFKKQRND